MENHDEISTMSASSLLTLSLPRVPSSKLRKTSGISFCKIVKNKQYHLKVLLNSFHLNGHTLGFCLDVNVTTTFIDIQTRLS